MLLAALPGRDFEVISGSTLEFTDVETLRSNSSNRVVLSIIDDNIAELCESFICTLQGDAKDQVRGVEPNQVAVRICDNDGEHKHVYVLHTLYELTTMNIYYSFPKELIVRWASDVYEFDEGQVAATVELVTDSTFEVSQVSIQGFPKQIPNGDPNRIDSLVVPGPAFPGVYLFEVKQLLFTLHIRHFINLFISDIHTFMLRSLIPFLYRVCL